MILFTISMQLQSYITSVDWFIIIKLQSFSIFFHVILIYIKINTLLLQMTVINLYLCFVIQNAIFDYTIPHNKCSSLVLPRGQLIFLSPYRTCVGRNSLLHTLLTLVTKNALLHACNLHLILARNAISIFLLSLIT